MSTRPFVLYRLQLYSRQLMELTRHPSLKAALGAGRRHPPSVRGRLWIEREGQPATNRGRG